MVRTRPAKRILRVSTSAISRPATIASATDSSVNRTVIQSDFLNFRSCGIGDRQARSCTAGTIMHRSHLPLKTWFMAVHIVTSHSNGISALQLQAQLGLGSYKSAWLLLHKLRRAMVDPDRACLRT